MASKSILIFVALFVLITKMESSVEFELVEDVESTENYHHHHHHHIYAKAPLLAPANAPTHAPKKSRIHAPAKAPVHAPRTGPLVSVPVKSPAPVSPPPRGCVAMCESYCRPISPKRACMRTCTSCCAKFKCVPGFTKCSNWSKVAIHGYLVKCP
ncbi:hypothetical protein ACS0TY_005892 [Phlomoides rotata]